MSSGVRRHQRSSYPDTGGLASDGEIGKRHPRRHTLRSGTKRSCISRYPLRCSAGWRTALETAAARKEMERKTAPGNAIRGGMSAASRKLVPRYWLERRLPLSERLDASAFGQHETSGPCLFSRRKQYARLQPDDSAGPYSCATWRGRGER